jgi:hypothetical protein
LLVYMPVSGSVWTTIDPSGARMAAATAFDPRIITPSINAWPP